MDFEASLTDYTVTLFVKAKGVPFNDIIMIFVSMSLYINRFSIVCSANENNCNHFQTALKQQSILQSYYSTSSFFRLYLFEHAFISL